MRDIYNIWGRIVVMSGNRPKITPPPGRVLTNRGKGNWSYAAGAKWPDFSHSTLAVSALTVTASPSGNRSQDLRG